LADHLEGVGALPSLWRAVAFGDLLADGTRNGVYKPKAFHGCGAKIVNMGELFGFPRLSGDVPMKRLAVDPSELEKFSLKAGDLLFARRSLVAEGAGKCCIVLDVSEPTVFESSIIRATPNPFLADSRYLFYVFESSVGRYLLGTILRQTAVAGITGTDLVRLQLPLPPLPEQRRIAAILGALDDKIELNRKMNRTLEEMAQALFKSWFVDFDGCEDLVESEIGWVPRGWEIQSLDAIADFLNGAACQKYPASEGEDLLPVIKIRELNQGVTTQTDRATATIPDKWHVRDGDVLFSWSGSLVVKVWTGGLGALNQHLFKVTSEAYPRWFFLSWVQHHLAEFQGIAADKATTMGHIKRHHLTDAKCVVPPADVLAKVGALMEPLVERMVANDLESRTITELRDILLPKLISGDLRMSEAEAAVSEAM
jgi:type I restriction enzyme S subunit